MKIPKGSDKVETDLEKAYKEAMSSPDNTKESSPGCPICGKQQGCLFDKLWSKIESTVKKEGDTEC